VSTLGEAVPAAEAERDERLVAWIEANVGGKVVHCERQARWRGGWWVDVERAGELLKLYVREERKEDFPPYPLEHEAVILQVLERHGVPVPHVYGVCEDPHAIVMEKVSGETDFSLIRDEAERVAVLEDYAEALARMHAIDPQELVSHGLKLPVGDAEIALPCFDGCDQIYLGGKTRPDPRIEFLRQWVKRNVPPNRDKVSVISVDSGQFLYENGKVKALFDLEYGCLGDPMIDVAFAPLRGRLEKMGDMRPFVRRYAELTGARYSADVMNYHAIWWNLITPMIVTPALNNPPIDANFYDYVGWYVVSLHGSFDRLAQVRGLEVEPIPGVDEANGENGVLPRWGEVFDLIKARLPELNADSSYAEAEQHTFLKLARRISLTSHREVKYLAQVSALTGTPVETWQEADRVLEQFVLTAGPEHDDALIRIFHGWCLDQIRNLMFDFVYSPIGRQQAQSFEDLIS